MNTFQVLEDAIELCRVVKPVADTIEKHDRKLAAQLRSSAQSAAANTAEGKHRRGGHQRERFGAAYGSAQEVKTHLRVAEAFGYCTEACIAKAARPRRQGRRLALEVPASHALSALAEAASVASAGLRLARPEAETEAKSESESESEPESEPEPESESEPETESETETESESETETETESEAETETESETDPDTDAVTEAEVVSAVRTGGRRQHSHGVCAPCSARRANARCAERGVHAP